MSARIPALRVLFGPLWREWCLWYYRRALREICPLHPDVPHIVRTINQLESA